MGMIPLAERAGAAGFDAAQRAGWAAPSGANRKRRVEQRVLFIVALWVLSCPASREVKAQEATIIHLYDDLGRLRRVIDENDHAATYNYDAVGNILSIERGAGECPPDPPSVTQISSESCFAGTSCRITIHGTGLLGAGVGTVDPQTAVSDCRADCTRIVCFFTASPFTPPGSTTITVITPFGSVDAIVDVLPPPSLPGVGTADLWHFAANRGDVITLEMTRIPNKLDGSSTLDPRVELRDSRGFLVVFDDDSGSSSPPGPGRNALIRDFVLPATDTYEITARGVGGTAGPYVLAITPPTIALVPGPITTPAPAEPDFEFSGEIASLTQRDRHTFAANSGLRVTIEVNRLTTNDDGSGTLDPAVELRDSRNFLLRADDDGGDTDPPGPGRNAIIRNLTLPATDTYSVLVFGADGTLGAYEVKVFLRE